VTAALHLTAHKHISGYLFTPVVLRICLVRDAIENHSRGMALDFGPLECTLDRELSSESVVLCSWWLCHSHICSHRHHSCF
ncbi:unnamed protein product, partial [Mycena citricolor]